MKGSSVALEHESPQISGESPPLSDAEQILSMAIGPEASSFTDKTQQEAYWKGRAMAHIAINNLPLHLTAGWEDIFGLKAKQVTSDLAVQCGLPETTTAEELAAYFDSLVPKEIKSNPLGRSFSRRHIHRFQTLLSSFWQSRQRRS